MHQFFILQIDFRANIDRLWPDDIMITVMEFKAKKLQGVDIQCNLDLVTLNLVTTCDLVTILQRPFS